MIKKQNNNITIEYNEEEIRFLRSQSQFFLFKYTGLKNLFLSVHYFLKKQ